MCKFVDTFENVKQILTQPCGHSRPHLEQPPAADHKTGHTHTHTYPIAFHITSSLSESAHYCQDLALTLGQPALLCGAAEVICAPVTPPRTTRHGRGKRGVQRGEPPPHNTVCQRDGGGSAA